MLVLPISCDNGCPEWSMIEMQGELERSGICNPDEEFPVGKLTLSAKAGLPCLLHWPVCTHLLSTAGGVTAEHCTARHALVCRDQT